jgi:electron transfer flavoprotein alpha subunit
VVLVVAEQRAGRLNPASLEVLAAAQQFGGEVRTAVLGEGLDSVCQALANVEVAEVLAIEDPALAVYTPDGFLAALSTLVSQTNPEWVLFPHTYQSRDFVPALAARLGRSLLVDCTAIRKTDAGLILTRPLFRGKINADMTPTGPAPHLVTFQVGAFRSDSVKVGAPAPIRKVASQINPATIRQRPEAPFQEMKQAVDLSQAERIVAVGRGIKDRDHLAVAETLARALGAELAASRPICDAGWLPMDRQVGSSGQTVAPKLYVALGISGAIQHIIGMKGARTIVAVNKDPDAPIFEIADYGIVGDLFEVVPALVAALQS